MELLRNKVRHGDTGVKGTSDVIKEKTPLIEGQDPSGDSKVSYSWSTQSLSFIARGRCSVEDLEDLLRLNSSSTALTIDSFGGCMLRRRGLAPSIIRIAPQRGGSYGSSNSETC